MTEPESRHRYPEQVPTLREYALLADGRRGVLVGPRGDYVWMCFPRWESDAVFSTLVGGPGTYGVAPRGRYVWGGYYEEGSLIWRSRWITEDGIVECREALAFPGRPHTAVLLRRIVAQDVSARLAVTLEPRPGFTAHRLGELRRLADGIWTGRAGPLAVRWSGAGDARAGAREGLLELELGVEPGHHHDLVLELSDQALDEEPIDPDRAWEATEAGWERAVPPLRAAVAQRDARHAYTVLRGLTAPSGGLVAAATTSLPERADADRNYDYRYVWIRDQCYAGQAAACGPYPLVDDAVRFVTARLHEDGPKLAPAYTAEGRRIPDQRRLDLPGFPGGYDVVGNQVAEQFQLDAFGESLLLLAAAARHDRLDSDGRRAAEIAADAIAHHWREPDAGMWELATRHWTHSRLICSAGLRSMAAAGTSAARAADWLALADTLLADAAANSVHPSGRWQRATDDGRLDAALLLPPIRGALPPDDPRVLRTLHAYTEQLTEDHFAYRFRHDERALGKAEGAFLLCGFVMALAEHQQGRETAAFRWFERNRAACGPPGLYSEEFDVAQRELRGNLPQAFVHALMLECALRLAEPAGTEPVLAVGGEG